MLSSKFFKIQYFTTTPNHILLVFLFTYEETGTLRSYISNPGSQAEFIITAPYILAEPPGVGLSEFFLLSLEKKSSQKESRGCSLRPWGVWVSLGSPFSPGQISSNETLIVGS